jgi:hypothetical protein
MIEHPRNENISKIMFIVVFLTFALATATCILLIVTPVSALIPSEDFSYILQGQEIISYTNDSVTLANGTPILLDTANSTLYLPQVSQVPIKSSVSILYTTDTDYSVNLNTSKEYATYDPANSTRIEQGQCVELGDTIDIAGIGWYTGYITYYGKYYDGYSYDGNASLVAIKKVASSELDNFYVDPSYFSGYPGWWYVYYQYDDVNFDNSEYWSNGQHGYDRLFYIGDTCKPRNATIADNKTASLITAYTKYAENLSALPEKKVFGAEYVFSKNETIVLPSPFYSHVWMFGRVDGIYDVDSDKDSNTFTLNGSVTVNMEAGSYDLLYTIPDGIGLFEQQYHEDTQTITSPLSSVNPLYIGDLQPREVETRFIDLVTNSYQLLGAKYTIDLQEPSIEVMKLDQWQGYNNNTLITIAGYTNANINDTIIIEMDSGTKGDYHDIDAHTWSVRAWGNISSYRYWNATFIFDVQNEAQGMHFITVTNDAGATAIVPFYVFRELPSHYIPQTYIQYIDNSPFIEPVKVMVTVEVPGPTEIVYQQVPPSQDQIDAAAKVIVEKQNARNNETTVAVVIAIMFVAVLVWGVSAYRRVKK